MSTQGSTTTRVANPRIGGVTFAKLFPNPEEPYRGIFVAEQVRATGGEIDWAVVAPVPFIPRWLARLLGKPYARGEDRLGDVTVARPRYPVLPRRILYATVAPLIALTARRAFSRAVSRTNARFVHAHDLYPSGAAAARLCRGSELPYVLTVHGLDLYSNLENPRWRREITVAAAGASAIVCVGAQLAHDCVAELGVDPRRVAIVPNTYDTARFTLVDRPRPVGTVRLLSVGRLSAEKGHDVLLRAFARLRTDGVDVSLVLVGDGAERSALEALAGDLGLTDEVRFAGTLITDELRDTMAEADLFVLPSRSEGFGVVLIEALATGLPVVATRSGGPQDIVGADDGVLVAPDDVDALVAGIREGIARLGTFDAPAIAARTAERFSPDVVGERLTGIYREVLSGGPISGALTGVVSR